MPLNFSTSWSLERRGMRKSFIRRQRRDGGLIVVGKIYSKGKIANTSNINELFK